MLTGALALAAVASVGSALPAHGASAPVSPQPVTPQTVNELRAEVERVAEELAAATVRWEQGNVEFNLLVQGKVRTAQTLQRLQEAHAASQVQLGSFAGTLYRNPIDPTISAAMKGNFRAVSDYRMVTRTLNRSSSAAQRDLAQMAERMAIVKDLLADQDKRAAAQARKQAQQDAALRSIQDKADASVKRLSEAGAQLRRQQEEARRVAAAAAAAEQRRKQLAAQPLAAEGSGGSCSEDLTADAINGFLPPAALCPLKTAPGQQLVGAAAEAFDEMSAAFAGATGKVLCVTDSYRDYSSQVDVFRRKPNLAATPGRSQHGWGRAVDLCGGVQQFGTAPYTWLVENAAAFGFVHPDWAEPDGSRPEPWHWEFQG